MGHKIRRNLCISYTKNNGKTNLNDKQWKSLNELWKLDELYCINGK